VNVTNDGKDLSSPGEIRGVNVTSDGKDLSSPGEIRGVNVTSDGKDLSSPGSGGESTLNVKNHTEKLGSALKVVWYALKSAYSYFCMLTPLLHFLGWFAMTILGVLLNKKLKQVIKIVLRYDVIAARV